MGSRCIGFIFSGGHCHVMPGCLVQYFRCPEEFDHIMWPEENSAPAGYFRFGEDATCFGNYRKQRPDPSPAEALHDALAEVVVENGKVSLPFSPENVVENLYRETYAGEWRKGALSILTQIYYFLRPSLAGLCPPPTANASPRKLEQTSVPFLASRLLRRQSDAALDAALTSRER